MTGIPAGIIAPMRKLSAVLLAALAVLALAAAGSWWYAGRLHGPSIQIPSPERFIGVTTPLEVVVDAPGGELRSLEVLFEQEGARTPLFSLDDPSAGSAAEMSREEPNRIRVTRDLGRESVDGIRSGPARIVVSASRPVLFGLRAIAAETTRDVQVRLERPRLSVVSTHHYVNQGGAELVVYRVTPEDVESGVVVGDVEYPGFPATGATAEGVGITDPAVRVAFFALRHDQATDTPIHLFARDQAGNSARADFDHRIFPKRPKQSRIELDDPFIERVVPAILDGTTEVKPQGSTIDRFLAINGELRRKNNAAVAALAEKTAPELLWRGEVFHPFTNTAVQSAFADHRTYYYRGREVDRQVHLGFDLASYAGTPIVAAARGTVLFADELGIYGNCVVLDHGMGVQSLSAHLSSIEVAPGDMVDKARPIGRSGMTGLAGGDHLHFTMLVNGQMVNPIEWWDPKWIEDRILRKLRAAS
ncbi:MAG TPA: M23 family metallopeptidase [Thermoanaerobaculia bacterium]|nr:M23 family metallopeptidase [Thermoanaerobaculia bacterium]